MKNLILSLTASALFLGLNMNAMENNGKKAMEMDSSQRLFLTFVTASGVIVAVEKIGYEMGLSESFKKGLDLTTVMGSMGWALKNRDLMEGAARLPLALVTAKAATSEVFMSILKNMPLFGDALSKMNDKDLEMLATLAVYTQIALPVYNHGRTTYINPYFGISNQ